MNLVNHPLNHVAVSVPSVEEAADWYYDVFGFTRLREDVLFSRNRDPGAIIFSTASAIVYPSTLNVVKVAFLQTSSGVGLEIFEFVDPPYRGVRQPIAGSSQPPPAFTAEYFTGGGFFHIAVTTENVDALGSKAVSRGARQIGKTVQVGTARALYLMDPWGNVFELLTRSFDEIARNETL